MGSEQLWQGGAWEQPQQAVEPLVIPAVNRKKKRSRKKGRIVFLVFLLLIAVLTATGVLLTQLGAYYLLPGQPDEGDRQHAEASTTIPSAGVGGSARLELQEKEGEVLRPQEIYEQSGPSIVYIEVQYASGERNAGSGVVMTADGYIITNAHVIEGAAAVRVVFPDNRRLDAGLVGYQSDYDLAVLKVQADDLIPARFGNSAQLQVGDTVVAIGNPLGSNLRGTMTEGIVSAIDRSVNMDGTTMTLIQTTAALNPGNSGGALINDRGQVVGITTMKMMSRYRTIEGLGFAIPTRVAKRLVDQIIATGTAQTPALGIRVAFDYAQYGGLLVLAVNESSDAWAQGLRAQDVIVAINGVPMTDDSVLVAAKEDAGVGGSLTLSVNRAGERLEFTVTLMDAALFE